VGFRGLRVAKKSDGHENSLIGMGLFKSQLKEDNFSVVAHSRLILENIGDSQIKKAILNIDELYGDFRVSQNFFVFIGQRKIVNGVAFGRNPTDFLNSQKKQDRTLSDEDRRAEMKGDTMLGGAYFDEFGSVRWSLLKPSQGSQRMRTFLQINQNIDYFSTNFSASVYYAENPGIGINVSSIARDDVTLYAEMAFRKKRDRKAPAFLDNKAVFSLKEDGRNWIANAVAGGQYTAPNGIFFTFEYWRNNNGYVREEISGIEKAITSRTISRDMAREILSAADLQINSTFFKIGNMELLGSFKGEIIWIHDLDRYSNLLRSSLLFDVNENNDLRIGFEKFSGPIMSAYSPDRVGIDKRIFINYKRYF